MYGGSSAGVSKTAEVKSKQPNGAKLYDMSGNVSEWCWDSVLSANRASRGGDWDSQSSVCAVAARTNAAPDGYHVSSGFRVASSAQ